jgi:hypothetical protein
LLGCEDRVLDCQVGYPEETYKVYIIFFKNAKKTHRFIISM